MTQETKKMLIEHYTRENYPKLVAMSGPWEIRSKLTPDENGRVYCAAIPSDLKSGHLPSHYGTMHHVKAMIRQGYVVPVEMDAYA
jgi:hypothetical protein